VSDGSVQVGTEMSAALATLAMGGQQHLMVGLAVQFVEPGLVAADVQKLGGLIDDVKSAKALVGEGL